MVEDVLSESFGPLTVGQCTEDWFLLQRFHFTGTTHHLPCDAIFICIFMSTELSDFQY